MWIGVARFAYLMFGYWNRVNVSYLRVWFTLYPHIEYWGCVIEWLMVNWMNNVTKLNNTYQEIKNKSPILENYILDNLYITFEWYSLLTTLKYDEQCRIYYNLNFTNCSHQSSILSMLINMWTFSQNLPCIVINNMSTGKQPTMVKPTATTPTMFN